MVAVKAGMADKEVGLPLPLPHRKFPPPRSPLQVRHSTLAMELKTLPVTPSKQELVHFHRYVGGAGRGSR